MDHKPTPTARLLVEVPPERYRLLSEARRSPQIGDVVVLDQGFTSSAGEPMVLAYFPSVGETSLYEAQLFESELE
jgi:hypothetical protein